MIKSCIITELTSSDLACVYWVMDAHGKFGEHERSALKLPKCIHKSIYAQLKAWTNSFMTWWKHIGKRHVAALCPTWGNKDWWWWWWWWWWKTYWVLKHVLFVFNHKVLTAQWRRTKVIRILKHHNQWNKNA